MNQHGFKWAQISQEFKGLHPRKQCRDRYLYQLKKDTAKNPWTDDEIRTLLFAQHRGGENLNTIYVVAAQSPHRMPLPFVVAAGNKWIEFSKVIPLHTESSVRNYWKNFLRGVTERYLIEQGRINQETLVSYYNFGERRFSV